MDEALEAACEEIDAAFFSGDTFHTPEALAKIEEYLGRWGRAVAGIKQAHPELSSVTEKSPDENRD